MVAILIIVTPPFEGYATISSFICNMQFTEEEVKQIIVKIAL